MNIKLEKASGRAYCRHLDCDKSPEYINKRGIKAGTICAAISMGSAGGFNTSYYCRGCIDKIYLDIKTILNPKLWIFT